MSKPPTKPAKIARAPISLDEAARRLGLDAGVCKDPAGVVRRMARRGEVIPVQMGRYVMVDPDSVDDLLGGVSPDPAAQAMPAAELTADQEIEALGAALARVIRRVIAEAAKK